MTTAKFFMVRHGQQDFDGFTDAGKQQAAAAARLLAELLNGQPVRLIATDAMRARQTADIIAPSLSVLAPPDDAEIRNGVIIIPEETEFLTLGAVEALCGLSSHVVLVGHQPQIRELYELIDRFPATEARGSVHHFRIHNHTLELVEAA